MGQSFFYSLNAFVALLPVRFDVSRWHADFLSKWPYGSAAWTSYWQRITQGPMFSPAQAVSGAR